MSNITISNAKLPAHLANRLNKGSSIAEAMAGGIASGEAIPKISIKSSRFRIIDGGNEVVLKELELETIIVGANPKVSKVFYSSAWTQDTDPEAPNCFSLNGVTPDNSVQNPQNSDCATCHNNQWGSKIVEGKELKACSDKKRLAVVAAGDPEGTVYLLEVTPAALRNLNSYQKELATRGIPVELVKTVVSFDPDASFPKLVFNFGGFLDEETVEIVEQLHGTPEVLRVTGESAPIRPAIQEQVEEEEEEDTEAVSFGKKSAPAKKKAPAKQESMFEEEAEEAEEPAQSFGKKKAKAAEEPAPKKTPTKKVTTKDKAESAASDDALSLASEIESLLGDDFDA